MTAAPRLLADGLVFGEGPRWRDDRLWFSDMHGEAVRTVTLDGQLETAVALPGREPSGLGWLPDGSLLIVSMQEREILRWDGDTVRVHADLADLAPDRCNDMVVDARGNAYVGTYPSPPEFRGVLIHVAPDGTPSVAAEDMRFPNGSVVADDGRTLIVAESIGRRLTRFTIADDGTLSDRATHVTTKPDGPDGICLDVEGAVWAGFPMAHEFRRLAPDSEVLDRISTEERLAIACTFGRARDADALPADVARAARTRHPRDTHATIHVTDVDVAGAGSP